MTEQPLFYCGDEIMSWRRARLREAMTGAGLDAVLTLKHDVARLITGFYAKGYRPFLDIEYATLFTSEGYSILGTALGGEEARARLRGRADEVRTLPRLRDWGPALAGWLSEAGLDARHVGYDLLPHELYQDITDRLPQLRLEPAAGLMASVLAVKHTLEVERLQAALAVAEAGLRAGLSAVRPGVTEIEVAATAEHTMRLLGSEMMPFLSVVASGTNAALWERIATPRRIGANEMVILDFGAVLDGYTGDVARTTVTGHASDAQLKLLHGAMVALEAAAGALRPGVRCGDVDARARQALAELGLANITAPWAVGHQVGYGLHGTPLLGPGVDAPLRAGMVVNIEPALYTPHAPEVGGVEIEDTYLITAAGARRLSTLPHTIDPGT